MGQHALGLIETVGLATAIYAADGALKAADVTLQAMERVIGVDGGISVTVHISGDVAAVQAGVDVAKEKGNLVGKVISAECIPRVNSNVSTNLLNKFEMFEPINIGNENSKSKGKSKPKKTPTKNDSTEGSKSKPNKKEDK